MTISEELRQDGYGRLEALGVRIGKPPRRRDASGRWTRADGGEWDWFYALSDSEREYVRRWHTSADAPQPDAMARQAGFDYVDDWAEEWMAAVRLTRPSSGSWKAEWERADWYADTVAPTPAVLVGPAEVANLLGVKSTTVHQWVARRLLPEPWATISGTRLWPRHEILEWAETTGRLPAEPTTELEAF